MLGENHLRRGPNDAPVFLCTRVNVPDEDEVFGMTKAAETAAIEPEMTDTRAGGYDFGHIERHWQQRWQEQRLYEVTEDPERPKYYCLEMFPYPSGSLHMGHVRNYAIGDVVARFKRMRGFNVLHPMGWDSFGLPAENAAIEHNIHPTKWTRDNVRTMREQLQRLGISYDWSREVASSEPDYYRWTQWLFLQFYKRDLAYKQRAAVNWCPSCATVLANEQVVQGLCERCDAVVENRDLEQWFFRITEYADELLEDLDELKGWPDRVKVMQRNWIGKSHGAEIHFPIVRKDGADAEAANGTAGDHLAVFTTRPDTIYGATYMVVAPDHPLVPELIQGSPDKADIEAFIAEVTAADESERTAEDAEKLGMFTGSYCLNPFTDKPIPIWIGNYVLAGYGTGAIMAVPAHDERDLEFARKYDLPVQVVIVPEEGTEADGAGRGSAADVKAALADGSLLQEAYVGEGVLVNSGSYDGTANAEAMQAIIGEIEEKELGEAQVQYRLRDWLISRQRYWGCPIPIVNCDECGTVPVPEEDLPVVLPEDVEFQPTGRSPLLDAEEFVHTTCPNCGGAARRETDTMDTFVDSTWYFLRFADPKADEVPFSKEKADYWMPVDQYIGGIEHAILHLMYARFFQMVLADMGLVTTRQPFANLLTQGMVLKDGAKMSKSRGNTVDPEEIIARYGVDTARIFSLFAAPPERDVEWSDTAIEGAHRFLNRVWRLVTELGAALGLSIEAEAAHTPASVGANGVPRSLAELASVDIDASQLDDGAKKLHRQLHATIGRVTTDVEDRFHFNTAIAAIMELVNEFYQYKDGFTVGASNGAAGGGGSVAERWHEGLVAQGVVKLILALAPFAPHLAEHLWAQLGGEGSVHEQSWPTFDAEAARADDVEIAVQVNGRVRGRLVIERGAEETAVEEAALALERVQEAVAGQDIVRVIVVPDRLVNIVVK